MSFAGEYRLLEDGTFESISSLQGQKARQCPHGWHWNIKVGIRCTASEERTPIAGFWYCDCRTHAKEEGRSDVCERPFTTKHLTAELLLLKLNQSPVR